MSSQKQRRARLSLIDRALIEQAWHSNAVRAQIHALMGDDSDQFVNAAGKVFFVVLGAAIREDVDPEMREIRILRGACNALYDQAGEPAIDDARRQEPGRRQPLPHRALHAGRGCNGGAAGEGVGSDLMTPLEPTISIDELREMFEVRDGQLVCRQTTSRRRAGQVVGSFHKSNGYWRVLIRGQVYQVHRVVWAICTGAWPGPQLDHIDRNKSNNRIENLREASTSENCRNRATAAKLRGVGMHRQSGKFQAQIGHRNKILYLGLYETREEAARAYDAAARSLHGEFATLNFPGGL